MQALLAAFLMEAARTPFDRRTANCGLFLADWAVALGRPDPAADLRGKPWRGSLARLVAARAAKAGARPVTEPQAGDVGLVRTATPRGFARVGAICTGPRWVVRAKTGLIGLTMPAEMIWRL